MEKAKSFGWFIVKVLGATVVLGVVFYFLPESFKNAVVSPVEFIKSKFGKKTA